MRVLGPIQTETSDSFTDSLLAFSVSYRRAWYGLGNGFRLITQRSVVQIHPPQPNSAFGFNGLSQPTRCPSDSNPRNPVDFSPILCSSFAQVFSGMLISRVSVSSCSSLLMSVSALALTPSSAVHDCRSPLKPHINLLPPSLNSCLNRGLLLGECFGQVELGFHEPIRFMLLDGELCRELAFS